MTDSAIDVARAAKSEHQALKELLKSNDHAPWEKLVEFQRKTLRRHYLRLLLVFPYSIESKDCENHLWMQTSYAFITAYKQRITALDNPTHNPHSARQSNHGSVEHRRLINRFRQFLAEEEKFWTKLVIRLCRSFQLTEATSSLVALGIVSSRGDLSKPEGEHMDERGSHNERNHHQFPSEDQPIPLPSLEQRPGKLAILSKTMICLGDIARYREQYNEGGGRSRAGHDDNVLATRGRHRRGGSGVLDAIPKPRNYDKAQGWYEKARLILPTEGNPFHQMAIIAAYKKDALRSILYYYRSLCVKQPYETAADNLSTVLSKALDAQKTQLKDKGAHHEPEISPRVRVDNFKEQVVALHALWYLGGEKMDSITRQVGIDVYKDFEDLVANRLLPGEFISNVLVLSQAALWRNRMVRVSGHRADGTSSSHCEYRIFCHLLELHRSLFTVGLGQLEGPLPVGPQEQDLGQRISAVFRRTLPALRIGSKWLRANLDYILKSSRTSQDTGRSMNGRQKVLRSFWDSYSQFLRALARFFPFNRLPNWDGPLDEDIDMRGFLPLKGMMDVEMQVGSGMASSEILSQVHPNDLELMRILDLIRDAQLLTKVEGSPLALYGGQFILKGVEADNTPDFLRPLNTGRGTPNRRDLAFEVDDDAQTEMTSHTDDVVREVFNFVDNHRQVDDDEREEEIVWDPRKPSLDVPNPIAQATPLTPQGNHISQSIDHATYDLPHTGTTARDLVNNIKRGSIPTEVGNTSNTLGPSIWSASRDEQSLAYPQAGQTSSLRRRSSVPRSDHVWLPQHPPPQTHAMNESRPDRATFVASGIPSNLGFPPPVQTTSFPFSHANHTANMDPIGGPSGHAQAFHVTHSSPYTGLEGHSTFMPTSATIPSTIHERNYGSAAYPTSPRMWNEVR